jgi:hypothetical protein
MPILFIVWLVGSIAIAAAGRNLRFGFWGYFFASLLLTPAIGVLLLIAAIPPRPSGRRR